jgi:hypothetical protein
VTCPRCGAPVERTQEYCLGCGDRLPLPSGVLARLSAGTERRWGWWPGEWVWPALLALLVAVAGAAVAIAATEDDGAPAAAIPTVTGGLEPLPTTGPAALPTAPEPETATSAPPTTTRPGRARPGARASWPAGKDGWTIILVSYPKQSGRAAPEAKAREARRNGLTQVGVLDSSRYTSLHAGYWVVFSGIYDSQAEAQSALPRARRAYRTAYVRQIAS